MNDLSIPRKLNEVFTACDNLQARSENITNESIMQELMRLGYRKGSNSDVTRYKNRWREQRTDIDEASAALPQRPDKLTQVIDEIRTEAQREARIVLNQFQADSDAKIKVLQETLTYANQEIVDLAQQKQVIVKENDELKLLITQSHHQIETLQNQYTKLQAEFDEKQKLAIQKIEHLTSEKEDLKNQNSLLIDAQMQIQILAKEERSVLMEKMENHRHQYLAEQEKAAGAIHRLEKELEKAMSQLHASQQHEHELKSAAELFNQLNDQLLNVVKLQNSQTTKMLSATENLSSHQQQLNTTVKTELSTIENKIHHHTIQLSALTESVQSWFSESQQEREIG